MVKEHFNVLCWKHCWVKHCPSAKGQRLSRAYLGGEAGGVQKACAAGKCCFFRAWIRLGRYSGSTHHREPFPLAWGEKVQNWDLQLTESTSLQNVSLDFNNTDKLMMHLNIAFLNMTFWEHFSCSVLYCLLSNSVYFFFYFYFYFLFNCFDIQMPLCSYNWRAKCLKNQ